MVERHVCIHRYKFQLSPVPNTEPTLTTAHRLDGMATGYGPDGPGIESRWWQDFPHLSRPALGSIQSPVQWVPGPSRG
jgi:hypothetical protein